MSTEQHIRIAYNGSNQYTTIKRHFLCISLSFDSPYSMYNLNRALFVWIEFKTVSQVSHTPAYKYFQLRAKRSKPIKRNEFIFLMFCLQVEKVQKKEQDRNTNIRVNTIHKKISNKR